MSFTTREDADVERLVNTLTMDEGALTTTNLTALSSTDLQQLADLSDNLVMNTDPDEQNLIVEEPMHMDVEGEEEIHGEIPEELHDEIHEEVIEGEDEMEIETDIIHSEEIIETKPKAVPPLRPLSIAPKPLQVKPVSTTGGQQLLFLQNAGDGQQIKLISTGGQNINFSNLSFGSKIAIKNAVHKTKTTISGKKLLAQLPKGLSKTAFDGKQQIMLVQKNNIIQSGHATAITPKTKTLTIAQAQEMGILTTKGTKQIIMNKNATKTLKLIPQQLKSRAPTKILPAPIAGKISQRIYIKASQPNTMLSNQMLQIAGGQVVAPGQIHQVVTGKGGVQYIKFVTQPESAETSVNTYAVKSGSKLIPISVATGSSMKSGNILLSEVKNAITTTSTLGTKSSSSLSSSSLSQHSSHAKLIPITTSRNSTQTIIHPRASSATAQTQINLSAQLPSSATQIVLLSPGYSTSTSTVHGVTTLNTGSMAKALQHVRMSGAGLTTSVKTLMATTVASSGGAVGAGQASGSDSSGSAAIEEILKMENNGMRPRKPCNCTKSQCLKLYCDCFANGEFCYMCNCMNCNNNIAHEEFRQRAIRSCLERNPNAFRPKIGKAKDGTMVAPVGGNVGPDLIPMRKHTKGCNCKRSGCLKNYCECYEAKIGCSSNCKCIGCRNMESDKPRSARSSISYSGETSPVPQNSASTKSNDGFNEPSLRPKRVTQTRQPFNFITTEVIEATSQCLLAISDNAETLGQHEEITKEHIIQEFGRCLKQIIDCAQTTKSIRGN